ncbi:MAG: molybdopterin-dependent oxidoreductase, partial [Proteobacteria bacterium]|nr:molybdopterin-dependent oxidoreductase [Pseudomonadota bacterium]
VQACGRGLAQGDVVRAPDRLTRPLRRAGPRGSGEFVPISWEEALSTVAGELTRVKKRHGPNAVFLMDSYGSLGALHSTSNTARRFFALFGGCTTRWGNTSLEGAIFASRATFGAALTGSTRDTFLSSRMIFLWGWNPVVTRFGPDTVGYLEEARRRGARVICVDPRRSPSAVALADEWVPIRPGTDTAMLIAMAQVLIAEDRCDREFLAAHATGFEPFADYALGRNDGVPKTPRWAEGITGVPAGTIERLAREYAAARPAALCTGWAPGRSAFGEQFHRAAQALCVMTGNVGVEGGWVAGGTGILPLGSLARSLPVPRTSGPTLHGSDLYDALLRGKAGGYPDELKLLYVVGSNFLNQLLNVNKGIEALEASEFVVVHELFLTPTARHADVVLPVTHFLEREDVGQPWAGGPYLIGMEKALDPLPETRTDLEIFTDLAARLGIPDYNGKSDAEWLEEFVAATPGLTDFDALKGEGVHRLDLERPWVAFRDQIEDPGGHTFRTPSGKIEIFSQKLAERNDPLIPPIPTYLPPWEGPDDVLTARFPLQLVSPHSRGRINSQGDNIPRLKNLADDELWLHPEDAAHRGIASGDRVRVSNDRGELSVVARVTDRILKGVVSLDAGAWFRHDGAGVDLGGSVNVLTVDRKSPGGAFPGSTCLVEVGREPPRDP